MAPILRVMFLSLVFASVTCADDSPDASKESEFLFVRRVAPLLREKCLGCHGSDPEAIEGALDLRSFNTAKQGGESGEKALVPGKPEESPLYLAGRRDHDDWSAMPPKEAEKLSDEQLGWLYDWIAGGAAWPDEDRQREIKADYASTWSAEDGVSMKTSRGLSAAWTDRKYEPDGLWAYQPLARMSFDEETLAGRNPIDVLIEQSLPEGLEPAPRATRRELIRRATFDLTGLPPSPDEVAAFLSDPRSDSDAFVDLIDRLLQSPHYGERMTQHWLDVVRYADSSGFANDYERGNAWRYRDYVVRAFNEDKPYDQFVREQIAGDEIDPDNPAAIIATGFLRMGPWELTGMEVAKVARQRFLDDVTNSVGETFLAHSLQCARCHDHKFDPVPTRDYYAIQAVFATTQLAERRAAFLPEENTSGFDQQRYLDLRRREYEATLDELDVVQLAAAKQWFIDEGKSSAAWDDAVAQARQQHPGGRIFREVRQILMRQGVDGDDYPSRDIGFSVEQFGRERVARKGLERLGWEQERYEPFTLAVYDGRTPQRNAVTAPTRIPAERLSQGELEVSCILTGGDPFSPGQPVTPGVLSVLDDQVSADIPTEIEGRRKVLADWIADPDNPLTPRVIVNRIWGWHFGKAIAGNPNNFGSTGKRPTHPQLLDWLAQTLVEDGWSIKSLHRRIMTSKAYARSTQHPAPSDVERLDPLGTSYAAFQPRRLSAEELRDAMLAATGELNRALGGIPCQPEINQEVAMQPRMVMGTFADAWVPDPRPDQRNRRSIYIHRLRGLPAPMLEVFNAPSPDFSCERRETSTVTPQVFSLFNSRTTHARALALADRAVRSAQNDREALTTIFRLLFSRSPSDVEQEECAAHWEEVERTLPEQAEAWPPQPLEVVREAVEENTGERFSFTEQLYSNADYIPDLQPDQASRHVRALADVCLVLLNSNEFVYVY